MVNILYTKLLQLSQASKKQCLGIEKEIIAGLEEAEFDLNDVTRFYSQHLNKSLMKLDVTNEDLYATKVGTFFNEKFETRLFFGVVFLLEPSNDTERDRVNELMKSLKEFTIENKLSNVIDTIVVNDIEGHFTP